MKSNIENRIRLAIQKSGRLSDESFGLLTRCGIDVKPRKEQLFCHSKNFPLDLLLVRDDDIPSLVSEGICDFGIVGTNLLQEQSLSKNQSSDPYDIIKKLDFAFCRLSIAVSKSFSFKNLKSLNNKRIATSYPNLLENFMRQNKLLFEVVGLSGSVEIAPLLGISDAICDLVSTGATLEANNLREVETLFESQAVLIQSKRQMPCEKKRSTEVFLNRVEGAELANGSKYIMLHASKFNVNTIVKLLPGAENPTVLELQGNSEKVAIHALCRENIFWETMENLKAAGATSILILPVEKIMY